MARNSVVLACLLAAWCLPGCGLSRPFETRPGTVDQQRETASMHDPYTDNDAGPEVVGARPREFTKPRSEPTRSRAHPASTSQRSWWNSWWGGE